jgi:hypothetical protein
MKYQTTFVITEDDVVHEADWRKVKCLIHPTEVKLNADQINQTRRRFMRNAAMTLAAAELVTISSAVAQPPKKNDKNMTPAMQGRNGSSGTTFGPLKPIEAGFLNVGYAEAGPANGPAVLLLHSWPYDIYSFVDVTPLLASAGYRVIVPYLRGYGTTRFLSSGTFRNGQPSVIALDIIALIDALKIDKAILAGFDWGGRTADIMVALWRSAAKDSSR